MWAFPGSRLSSPYVFPSAKGETPIGVANGDPQHGMFIFSLDIHEKDVPDTNFDSDLPPP
jgi:hypothetical protein